MPFFIHDVAYGIKSPIDISKINDRLSAPNQLNRTRPAERNISPTDPQVQRDLIRHQPSTKNAPGRGYGKIQPNTSVDDLVAEHIMSSPVIYSSLSTPVKDMLATMEAHEIHHLVITDDQHVAVGILQYGQLAGHPEDLRSILSPILSTTVNTPLSHVAYVLLQSGRDAILVSENDEILGIITTKNFLRLFAKEVSFEITA